MTDRELFQYAQQLTDFIRNKKFETVAQWVPYQHMGATITDAVLQAGVNYQFVVYPRIHKLLSEFPDYRTTCDFLILIQTIPLSTLIRWSNLRKLQLIQSISWMLFTEGVECEADLADWLSESNHTHQLTGLQGVGPKTVDYLKMLSGCQAIAIDRHLFHFLRLANISTDSYQEASNIYCKASELLSVSPYQLDRQIWSYMSGAYSNS